MYALAALLVGESLLLSGSFFLWSLPAALVVAGVQLVGVALFSEIGGGL
jgi:hypothetical protein